MTMEIKTKDDINLVMSLCDMCIKINGLNTSPRVYALAEQCRTAMTSAPDVPTPLNNEDLERAEKIKQSKKTLDDLNGDRL